MTTPDIHTRAQEALSAAHDATGPVRSANLRRAHEHLRRCPRCRAFEAALSQRGPAAGGPQPHERASEELISRIVVAVEAERLGIPAQMPDETETATAEPAPPAPADAPRYTRPEPRETKAHRWGGRRSKAARPGWRWGFGVAITTAAVIALFVGARVVVGPDGLGSGGITSGVLGGANTASAPGKSSAESAATLDSSGATAGAARGSSSGAPPAAAPRTSATGGADAKGGRTATSAASSEPAYARQPALLIPPLGPEQPSGYVPPVTQLTDQPVFLSFGTTDAWRFCGWLRNTPPTSLIRVGEVRARLGAALPRKRAVYESPGDRSTRYVQWGADDFQVYRPVRQPIGLGTYVLTTSIPIADWGRWPAWPSRALPYPGTRPGFAWTHPADSRDMPAYVVPGIRASRGLAVPPGARWGSPAVELPGWSWWRARGPR